MTEANLQLPSLDTYIEWVLSKPSNINAESKIGILKTYPSRFGLTQGQMTVWVRILQTYGMFFEKRGLIGGGKGEGSRNLGDVLTRERMLTLQDLFILPSMRSLTVKLVKLKQPWVKDIQLY